MRRTRLRHSDTLPPIIDWRCFDAGKIIHPTWLVDGIIPEGSTCCIYGAPNTGKSFLALDMALAIASGQRWLDIPTRNDVGKTKERGKVVYILAECPDGLNRRIAAWLEHHGIPREDGERELSGCFFIPLVENIRLDRPADLDRLVDQIRTHCPDVALIVFDPLVSFMNGDENSAHDMQALIDSLRKLVAQFNESHCSVLVVHHSGKDDARNERGSSALRGGVDTHLRLTPFKLQIQKQRDAAKHPDIPVEFVTVVEAVDDGTRDLGKVVVKGKEPSPRAAERQTTASAAVTRESSKSASGNGDELKLRLPAKLTVPQKRLIKNRELVLQAVSDLMREQPNSFFTKADIQRAVGKKFDGGKSTFYPFLDKMAEGSGSQPASLIKNETGGFQLASIPPESGNHDPVYSSVVPSQDDPSRPAEAAALIEGQVP